jgi:hypothetical protein
MPAPKAAVIRRPDPATSKFSSLICKLTGIAAFAPICGGVVCTFLVLVGICYPSEYR